MTVKSVNFLIFFLCLLLGCQSGLVSQIDFPQELERINTEGTVEVNFEKEKKVVFYLDISERGMLLFSDRVLNWTDFSQQYPNVMVLVYLSGIDHKEVQTKPYMKKYLASYDFPYQVFLDPGHQLYNFNSLEDYPLENKYLQAYYVKGNQVLGIARGFGIEELREQEMEKYFGDD